MGSAARISNYAAVGVAQLISMYARLRGNLTALQPVILGITPNVGPLVGGTLVRITGYNFEGASATIGGAACTSPIVGGGIITCYTPAGSSGAKDLVVTGPGGSRTLAGAFTYPSSGTVPVVSAVSPNVGDIAGAGGFVTITVDSSTGCTGATLGGVAMTSFSIVDATHVKGIPGAHAAAVVDAVVTNATGASTTGTALFEYFNPATLAAVKFFVHANKGVTGGGAVSAWLDQSSNALNFVQATGGFKPAQTASVFGTMPSIRFTGGTQFVKTAALIVFDLGYTVYCGCKTSQTYAAPGGVDAPGTILGQNGGSNWGGMGFDVGASPTAGLYVRIYDAVGVTSPITLRGSNLNDGTARMIGFESDIAVSPGPNRQIYVGTTQQGATAAVNAGYDTVNTAFDSIGAGSAGADGFVGDMAWMLAVDATGLSSGNRTKLATWSLQQFGF